MAAQVPLQRRVLECAPRLRVCAGLALWLVATSDGEVYSCDPQEAEPGGQHEPMPSRPANASSEAQAGGGSEATQGQLGRAGDPTMPGRVLVPGRAVAVAAGREHGLVATAEGHVYSWGSRCAASAAWRKGGVGRLRPAPLLPGGERARCELHLTAPAQASGDGSPGWRPGQARAC